MAYSVKELAELAGVSSRALRYYDEINLLKPAYVNISGYRMYEQPQVNRLQQILFFKTLGFSLDVIRQRMNDENFNEMAALKSHLTNLLQKKEALNRMITTVEMTIEEKEGRRIMNDLEKFEGLKKTLIEENERYYGEEIREKYGEEMIDASYLKFQGMKEADYEAMLGLEKRILSLLDEAFAEKVLAESKRGWEIGKLHRKWLSYTWPSYSLEAHQQLGEMYVADERFKEYYDRGVVGKAAFLRDAINYYCQNEEV